MDDNSKHYEGILMKLFGRVGHDPRKKWLDFVGDPDSFVDFGSSSCR